MTYRPVPQHEGDKPESDSLADWLSWKPVRKHDVVTVNGVQLRRDGLLDENRMGYIIVTKADPDTGVFETRQKIAARYLFKHGL